jgi:hypothetical protein
MPTVTHSRVWFLVTSGKDAEPLKTPRDLTRAAQLVENDPETYRLEQRGLMELQA